MTCGRSRPSGLDPRTLLAAVALAVSACGGSGRPSTPTGPSLDAALREGPLVLSTERYLLEIQGFDVPESPSLPACDPVLMPAGGKNVTTFVWFEQVGPEWIGRSRPPYDAVIELRLRRVGSEPGAALVAGTVRGTVADEYDRVWGRRDSVFRTFESAAVDGRVTPGVGDTWVGHEASGVFRGDIWFTDRAGHASGCTNVRYALRVRPPGGPDDDPTVPPLADAGFGALAR